MINMNELMASRGMTPRWYSRQSAEAAARENAAARAEQQRNAAKSSTPQDSVSISDRYYAYANSKENTQKTPRMPTEEEMAQGGHFNEKMEWVSSKEMYENGGVTGIMQKTIGGDSEEAKTRERIGKTLETLIPEKKFISDRISSIAKENGLSDSDVRKLKIEINSAGKVVVGGLSDTKMTKQIQNALNKDGDFASRLKNYQNQQRMLSSDMRSLSIGGGNLGTGLWGLENIEQAVRQGADENGTYGADFNDPLAYAAAELFTGNGADFSYTAKGVADPLGAMRKGMDKAKTAIEEMFTNANNVAGMKAANNGNVGAVDQMSLKNAKINITADGQVSIEGRFAASDSVNSEAEALVRKVIAEVFEQANVAAAGGESIFATAARQLQTLHDESFGEGNGAEKQVVMTINGGKTDAYISSPGAQEALQGDVRREAAALLSEQSGAKFSENDLEVDAKGAITLKAAPKGVAGDKAEALIAQLNKQIAEAGKNPGAATGENGAGTAVESIATKIREMTSYGPDGDTAYTRHSSEAAKEEQAQAQAEADLIKSKSSFVYEYATKARSNMNEKQLEENATAPKRATYRGVDDGVGGTTPAALHGAYNERMDEAFDKWLAGEGEFNVNFIDRQTSDGHYLEYNRTEDSSKDLASDRLSGYTFRRDGGAGEMVFRHAAIPGQLDDLHSGAYEAFIESLKDKKPEDFVFIDTTGLTKAGFSKEEREDFLNMVDTIISESGYTYNANQLAFEYSLDVHRAPVAPGSSAEVLSIGGASIKVGSMNPGDSRNETMGMRGNINYTSKELEEMGGIIAKRITNDDAFWDKGYAQKLAESTLAKRDLCSASPSVPSGAWNSNEHLRKLFRWA